jgi:mRNA interferase MazF
MMLKQRDIVLIPVPFTDLSSKKRRPVIVLSNSRHNETQHDFLGVAVTSNVQKRDYSVLISQNDLEEGNLKATSMILADKIYALSQGIVVRKFGRVNKKIFSELVGVIGNLIRESE